MYERKCSCPCKCEPIVLEPRECIKNYCYYVEQPIICPVNIKHVHHYIPRPVYYSTYSKEEENICYGKMKPNTTQK